jgi:tetratricopeptide (TPR) repeat protein
MSNETVEGLSGSLPEISFLETCFGKIAAVVGFIAASITIFWALTIVVRYFRNYFHKKIDIRDSFPFKVIKPEELEDELGTTVKGLHYVKRPESETKASESEIGTLIIGKPHAGKTREALEVVRSIRRDVTVLIPESRTYIDPFKVPNYIGGDVVLFFDDLPNYYASPKEFHESFERTIKTLDDACNSVYVVTTARTTELDKLYEYPGNFWDCFKKIELDEFGDEETRNLIDELCKHFEITIDTDAKEQIVRENDRTPKNIVFFFKEMNEKDIQRVSSEEVGDFKPTAKENWDVIYNKLSEDERSVFRALDVIHECGVIPNRKFVSVLAGKIHRPKPIFWEREIGKSIDILIRKRLIEEKESLILCDDIYREGRGDVDENIKNLIKILFNASKDRKLNFFAYLSLMGFADVLSARKKFAEEQIEVTRKIIELNPDLAAAHSNLGNMLKDQGRYDEAEKEYRDAIQADPDDAAAHSNLGLLLNDQGRYDEAEKEYRDAIQADLDLAAAHYNLGVLLNNLERYDEAEKEYRDAIQADPDYAAAHSNLGVLLKDQGRSDEAEKEYRDAILADPDYAAAHANLGILFLATERPEEAEKEFGIAKELFRSQGRDEDVKNIEELLSRT